MGLPGKWEAADEQKGLQTALWVEQVAVRLLMSLSFRALSQKYLSSLHPVPWLYYLGSRVTQLAV